MGVMHNYFKCISKHFDALVPSLLGFKQKPYCCIHSHLWQTFPLPLYCGIGHLSGVSSVTKARWWMVEKSFIWAAEAAFGMFPVLH